MHGQDAEAYRAAPRRLGDLEHTDQDWYANLIWLDGRKCLFLAHAGTLFSVFVPDIHKADLVPIGPSVVAFIHKELVAEGLPLDRFGVLDSRSIELAKTESRTVLGYMNEMARFCEYAVVEYGGLARCADRRPAMAGYAAGWSAQVCFTAHTTVAGREI